MADERRELATEPATDPEASSDQETSEAEPAVAIADEADAPLSPAEASEPEGDLPKPAETGEPEASTPAVVAEPINPESASSEAALATLAPEGNSPAPDLEDDESVTDPHGVVIGPIEMGASTPVLAAASSAPPTEPVDVVVTQPERPADPEGPSEVSAEGAADEEPTTGRRALTFFREFVETILLTLVIFVAVRTLVVNFRVDGESMRPTLANGEYLLVNRATYFHLDLNSLRNILPGPDRRDRDVVYLFGPPERGDIIVFEPPINSDKPFVKRVIGLPGDTIAVREDHRVYVNGQPLEEHYIAAPPQSLFPAGGGSYTVPPGMIFVMGDNRNNSQDSRVFSAVSLESVIGKAVVSYWPLDVFGFIPHERYALAGDER